MWGVCAILTTADVFDDNNPARTDTRSAIFREAEWFRVPYPCKLAQYLFLTIFICL